MLNSWRKGSQIKTHLALCGCLQSIITGGMVELENWY